VSGGLDEVWGWVAVEPSPWLRGWATVSGAAVLAHQPSSIRGGHGPSKDR